MHWGYVIAGWSIVFAGTAVYAAAIVRRGRRLSERVPEDRRRFLD
jgi:hypothetical protein